MSQYPGLKTGANRKKDQSRQKESKSKVKGNTWSEQDDALFGPSPSMYCEPCASTARTSTTTKNEKQSASASSINKLHLKVSAKNVASKLTGFITKARDDVVDATLEAKRTNDKAWNKKNAAIPISSARKPAPTRASLPAFTTSVPAPMKPPPSHNFGMRLSKIVTETLTSQVPFPCAHCNAIPLMYQYHPFFGKAQRICSTHPLNSVIQCVSCSRYQTRGDPFAAIGTSSARICPACARSAILDNGAAKMLYEHVLQFMESQGLDMFDGKMKNIPVILADENSLDRQSSSIGCEAKGQKRGLTIWREMYVPIPNVLSMAKSASKLMKRVIGSKEASSYNGGEDEVKRNVWAGTRHVDVVKILCLKGLPRNLMASILAHEATHAWLALNPIRRDGVLGDGSCFQTRRIDSTIEEGLCQLVAHLYLQTLTVNDQKDRFRDNFKKDGPTDSKLNEYFKWSIENHTSPVYGGGFKMAARAYTQIIESGGGLKELMQYVCIHRNFPPP